MKLYNMSIIVVKEKLHKKFTNYYYANQLSSTCKNFHTAFNFHWFFVTFKYLITENRSPQTFTFHSTYVSTGVCQRKRNKKLRSDIQTMISCYGRANSLNENAVLFPFHVRQTLNRRASNSNI